MLEVCDVFLVPHGLRSHSGRLLFRVIPPSLMLLCTQVPYIEQNSVNQKFNISSDRLDLSVPTNLSAFVHIPQMTDEMWRPQQVSAVSQWYLNL